MIFKSNVVNFCESVDKMEQEYGVILETEKLRLIKRKFGPFNFGLVVTQPNEIVQNFSMDIR